MENNYTQDATKVINQLVNIITKNNATILKINIDTKNGVYIVLNDNGKNSLLVKNKVAKEFTEINASLGDSKMYYVNNLQTYQIEGSTIVSVNLPIVVSDHSLILEVPLSFSDIEDFMAEMIYLTYQLIGNYKHLFVELSINKRVVLNNFSSEQELLTYNETLNLPLFSPLTKQSLILSPVSRQKNQPDKNLKFVAEMGKLWLFHSTDGLFVIHKQAYARFLFKLSVTKNSKALEEKEILLLPFKLEINSSYQKQLSKNLQFLKNYGFNFNQAGDITSYAKIFIGTDLNSVITYLLDLSARQQSIDYDDFARNITFLESRVMPQEAIKTLFDLDFNKYKSDFKQFLRMIDIFYLENLFK